MCMNNGWMLELQSTLMHFLKIASICRGASGTFSANTAMSERASVLTNSAKLTDCSPSLKILHPY